jgi:hypothetical protein
MPADTGAHVMKSISFFITFGKLELAYWFRFLSLPCRARRAAAVTRARAGYQDSNWPPSADKIDTERRRRRTRRFCLEKKAGEIDRRASQAETVAAAAASRHRRRSLVRAQFFSVVSELLLLILSPVCHFGGERLAGRRAGWHPRASRMAFDGAPANASAAPESAGERALSGGAGAGWRAPAIKAPLMMRTLVQRQFPSAENIGGELALIVRPNGTEAATAATTTTTKADAKTPRCSSPCAGARAAAHRALITATRA